MAGEGNRTNTPIGPRREKSKSDARLFATARSRAMVEAKKMAARNQHVWNEVTPEGEKREVRAVKFGGRWKLQSKLRGDGQWTYHDKPTLADLESLQDVIFRKYQRRRAAYEDVQEVGRMLTLARGEASPSPRRPDAPPAAAP
jgi:hypothetical protein